MYCVTLPIDGVASRPWWRRLEGAVTEAAPLARHTTYRVGGPAEYLVVPANAGDVALVFASGEPVFVMGAGSNLLVADAGFDGVVLKVAHTLAYLSVAEGEVVVGAGRALPSLVQTCVDAGLAGMEWAVGIPGTVGGATATNAGAFGGAMWDRIVYAEVVTAGGKSVRVRPADVTAGYRRVTFPFAPPFAVVEVALAVTPAARVAVAGLADGYRARRQAGQPQGAASAGCVFKNPPAGPSAGELIDRAGLKGHRRGGAVVSEKHANFILNAGGATAADIYGLLREVQRRVREASGVELELELTLVGDFGDGD